MCDTKCGGGSKKQKKISGPPENLPAWLQCPPKLKERSYPAPSGVEILPLSVGGRNGGSGGKKLNCGQCGSMQDEKRKPNAPADCPMMKQRCPGADDVKGKASEKSGGGGVMAKIQAFFGKGDSKLVEACKKLQLQVPDEQIRRRDEFDTHLICRKDGYFSPFMSKVDCEGVDDEECEEEDVLDEDEDCEEEEEEEEEDEEDCEEEEEEEYEEEGNRVIEIDGCKCTCECPKEQEEEEECVQDAEGECIIEESAECMDESCKFFLDGSAKRECIIDEKLEGEDLGPVEPGPEEEDKNKCKAMSNFIIRVQAPFSECSTNETCEQILERLTKKTRQIYPEPAQPEQKSSKEEVEIIVKQISVEDPSCEPIPKPKKKCKKKDGKKEDSKEKPPVKPPTQDPPPVTPPPPPPKPEPFIPPTPPPEPPKDPCPPPKESVSDSPPPSNDSTPRQSETKEEAAPEAPEDEEPSPPPRNDCDTLNEAELLKKRLQDIRCGCKTVCPPFGSLPEREIPVWTPPTPPSCSRCGAKVRGDTEDCFLCSITRRMRSGDYEEGCPPLGISSSFDPRQILDAFKEDPAQCTPEYLPDGSIKYKGGMCTGLAGKFLWHAAKKIQPGGFFSKFTGDCGLEERLQALTGSSSATDAFANKNDEKPSYNGGMLLAQCRNFLWGKAEEPENTTAPPICKPRPKPVERQPKC